jgi:hypothetical protein
VNIRYVLNPIFDSLIPVEALLIFSACTGSYILSVSGCQGAVRFCGNSAVLKDSAPS